VETEDLVVELEAAHALVDEWVKQLVVKYKDIEHKGS
jgi:hypothetical protein